MVTRIAALLTAAIVISAAQTEMARAESWPDLTAFVPKCPLIVHVRTVPQEVEPNQTYTLCSVVEAVRGEYRPLDFASPPPTGFIILSNTYTPNQEGESLDLIAFYGLNSVNAEGLLLQPDMTLVVKGDTVMYPPAGELGDSQPMSLADFKRHIKAIASDVAPDQVVAPLRTPPAAPRQADMEGSWRVFLPAGFEQAVTVTRIAGDRYQLAPRSLAFSGVYELQGTDLVLIESSHAAAGDYRWQMHSTNLISLVEQNHACGASYLGAAMFRPKPAEPAAGDTPPPPE